MTKAFISAVIQGSLRANDDETRTPGKLHLRVKKVYIDHAHDFTIPHRGCVR
jgi:hypothetical protein